MSAPAHHGPTAEARALLAASGHRWQRLFELALHAGLCKAELLDLRAGLRTIRFHDLRHSTATLLLEQGVDLVVIKELLGHAHIGVTAGVYAHVRLRLQRQAIDALNDVLGTGSDDREDPPSAASVR